MIHNMRRLYPRGTGNKGICVDAEGAMLGPGCVLVGRTSRGYRALERDDAAALQKCMLSTGPDSDWLFRQCQRIADALDKGELALAQIYGLYVPVVDLDDRVLTRISLAKAGFNPDEPRIPKGDHGGGEWTTGDAIGTAPGSSGSPPAVPLRALDVASTDADESPPLEFRIVSPDTDTPPHKAAPESSSSSETAAGITPTSGTGTASTVGEREVASHHSPGNSGGATDYHGDAIYPDYTFENLLLFLATRGSNRAFRRVLAALGWLREEDHAHHIVPKRDLRSEPARNVLERFGIGVDDPVNGVSLPPEKHWPLNATAYHEWINQSLAAAKTRAEAEDILRSIARKLQEGTLP